jgi:hypothetical protein
MFPDTCGINDRNDRRESRSKGSGTEEFKKKEKSLRLKETSPAEAVRHVNAELMTTRWSYEKAWGGLTLEMHKSEVIELFEEAPGNRLPGRRRQAVGISPRKMQRCKLCGIKMLVMGSGFQCQASSIGHWSCGRLASAAQRS